MLAVLILSYNHPELTSRTVKSVLDKKMGPVFLIHNGSEIKNIEKLKEEYPQITHLVMKDNRGFSGGANFGLRFMFHKYDWCLFLTNDCELAEIGSIPQKPALVAPHIWIRHTKKIHSLGGSFQISRGHLRHCMTEEEFSKTRYQKYIPGTAFLIHKEVFLKTGGFDEKLFTYWEDVDFSVRTEKLGFPLLTDASWKIHHGVGKTCHKNPLYTIYYFQRNRKIITTRYSKKQKTLAYINMTQDWLRLGYKLIKNKRYQDLKLLYRATMKKAD